MQNKFNLNDKVQITYRDETVIGVVDELTDTEFHVSNVGWFPNDVGNYVQLIN